MSANLSKWSISTNTFKPARDLRIDLIRGICIIGVVSIHFGGSFLGNKEIVWTDPFYLGLFLNQIFSFAVPAFVFLSGWALELPYNSRGINWPKFYQSRLTKIATPYFVVTAVYFILLKDSDIIRSVTVENILPKLFYYGVHPTLYFIPLIVQLYFLYPFLREATDRLGYILRLNTKTSNPEILAKSLILLLLFIIHIALGHLCYSGKINYYTFCRPFSPFWAFYFYAGMYFRQIKEWLNTEKKLNIVMVGLLVSVSIFFSWNITKLLDINTVGPLFEKALLDLAYSIPKIMAFNIASVALIGVLLLKNWSLRSLLLEKFGRFSYHIYLWHILVLLYLAWQQPAVLATCIKFPEVMLLIILFTCVLITSAIQAYYFIIKSLMIYSFSDLSNR